MQQVKHHRGRMSIQGKKFLMNLDETDPNVIREMFMRKFGRLITDRVIFKYSNQTQRNADSTPNNNLSLSSINFSERKKSVEMKTKRLVPESIYISGNEVRISVKDSVYEIPLSLFSADFIISLRDKVANNLKNQLDSLNGSV